MSSTFFIQFKPLGPFFFGGEQTFGSGTGANYFARSRKFPQQTTILGVMRHLMYLGGHEIGPSSFDGGVKEKQDFGVIKSLTPVRIIENKKSSERVGYPGVKGVFCPDENDDNGSKFSRIKPEIKNGFRFCVNGLDYNEVLTDHGFKAKKTPNDYLVFGPTQKDKVPEARIFKKYSKVGIQKTSDQTSDHKGFYKQRSYVFANNEDAGYSFGMYLSLDQKASDYMSGLNGSNLYMGGEKSGFVLSVQKSEGESHSRLSELYRATIDTSIGPAIVFLSDTWINSDDPNHFRSLYRYGVIELDSFRNIYSPPAGDAQSSFSSMGEVHGLRKKKKALKLIRAGSVIWPREDAIEEIISLIDSEVQFRQIGYNQYLTLDKM